MTALHRAGLVGLWMTLDALDREGRRIPGGSSWSLLEDGVDFHIAGEPRAFFDFLIKWSFKVEDGRVWLPALWRPRDDPEASAFLNEFLLGTFLQHNRARKSDPAGNPMGTSVVTVDEKERPLRYHRIFSYQHQRVKIRRLDEPQRFVGWLYPGSTVRHAAFDATGTEEPLDKFLPLLYSIIGVLYFMVRRRGAGTRYAVVIPDVTNIKAYALFRSRYAPRDERHLTVSGAGEAALRLLAALEAKKLTGAVGSYACRVVMFGKVQWAKQQRVRVQVFDVKRDVSGLAVYEKCEQYNPARLVKPEGGTPFWDFPQVPELVAENLIGGRLWWTGFSRFISDKDVGDHIFGFSNGRLYKGEREGLSKMVFDPGLGGGAEAAFVEACHEAWRRRLGAIGQSSHESGQSFSDAAEKELLKVRLSFSRCKNEATLRETLVDFWARAGSLPSLRSDWRAVLSLMNRDWQLAKDLALLALASYAPKDGDGEGEGEAKAK